MRRGHTVRWRKRENSEKGSDKEGTGAVTAENEMSHCAGSREHTDSEK